MKHLGLSSVLIILPFVSGYSQKPNKNIPQTQLMEMAPHASLTHYVDEKQAFWCDKSKSNLQMALGGMWQMFTCESPALCPNEFPLPTFDASSWQQVKLPSAYTFQRNKENNTENKTFAFRKTFPIPADWFGQQVVVHLNACGPNVIIWINGKRIGYSKTADAGAEFNITSFLKFGRMNVLAIQTTEQDSKNQSVPNKLFTGIFGEISLQTYPNVAINDILVTTTYKENKGYLKLEVAARRFLTDIDEKFKISVYLKDAKGKDIISPITKDFNPSKKADSTIIFEGSGSTILPWDNEKPNLYSLMILLKNKKGQLIDVVSKHVGFKSVSLTGNNLTINNKEVLLKYAQITDSLKNQFMEAAEIKKLLLSLKKDSVNVIRTTDIISNDAIIESCNKNGMFVIHDIPTMSNDAIRSKKYAAQLKNETSIISLGQR